MNSFSNELQSVLRKPLSDFVRSKMTEAELNMYIKRFNKFQSVDDTRFLLMTIRDHWNQWTASFSRRSVELENMRKLLNMLAHPSTELDFTWADMNDHMTDFYSFLDLLSTVEYNVESARHARKQIELIWEKVEKNGFGPFYNYTIESIYRVRIHPKKKDEAAVAQNIGIMLGSDIDPKNIVLELTQYNDIKSFIAEVLGTEGTIDNSEEYFYYMIEQMDEETYNMFKKLFKMLNIVDDLYMDGICIFRRKEEMNSSPMIGGVKFEMKQLNRDTFMIKSDYIEEVEKRLNQGGIQIIAKSHKTILVQSKREMVEKTLSFHHGMVSTDKIGGGGGGKKRRSRNPPPQSSSPLKKKGNETTKQDRSSEVIVRLPGLSEETVNQKKQVPKVEKANVSKKTSQKSSQPQNGSSKSTSIQSQSEIVNIIYKIDIKSENEWTPIKKFLESRLKFPCHFLAELKGQFSLAVSMSEYKQCEDCLDQLKVSYCLRQNQVYFSQPLYTQYFLKYRADIESRFRCKITSSELKNKMFRFGFGKKPRPHHIVDEFIASMVGIISHLHFKKTESIVMHKSHLNSFNGSIRSISETLRVFISLNQRNHETKDDFIHINASLLGFKLDVLKAIDQIEKTLLSNQISSLQIQQRNANHDDRPLKVGYHYLIYFRMVDRQLSKRIGKQSRFTGELKKEIEEKMKNICVTKIRIDDSYDIVPHSKHLNKRLSDEIGIALSKKVVYFKLQNNLFVMTENNELLELASRIIEKYIKSFELKTIAFSNEDIKTIKVMINLPKKRMRSYGLSIHPHDFDVDLKFDGNEKVIIKGTTTHIEAYVKVVRDRIVKFRKTPLNQSKGNVKSKETVRKGQIPIEIKPKKKEGQISSSSSSSSDFLSSSSLSSSSVDSMDEYSLSDDGSYEI